MASHIEGRLLRRSMPLMEGLLADLAPPAPKAKAEKKPKAAAPAAAPAGDATAMSRCCFAVGKVTEVSKHPESAKLFIEKIDLGEELNAMTGGEPRVILSGLQEHVKEEDFLNRLVLVIANLEPRKIAGIPSNGMVLCASVGEDPHDPSSAGAGERSVVLLNVPEGTGIGERIVFPGHEMPYEPVLKKKLAKNFEEVIAEVHTNADGVVCWKDLPFCTSKGPITASLNSARIS